MIDRSRGAGSGATVLLFDATGDLARRVPLPSLTGLHADGLLAQDLRIICAARSEHDDSAYDDGLGRPSDSETFVALRAYVDNWRWRGVPFYLRTGKRLPEGKVEIVTRFKEVPHPIFAVQRAKAKPSRLVIGIQPAGNITLSLMAKVPGLDRDGVRLRGVPLNISMSDALYPCPEQCLGRELFALVRAAVDSAEHGASAMLAGARL